MAIPETGDLSVRVEENVAAEMRDGTVLRADVYRPVGAGSYPVLLCRTPYDKASDGNVGPARELASRGYVVAVQDIRGRYASEGEFLWMFQDASDTRDAEDGYDSVEWAAGLPASDGQVGTWGHSYPAWCTWRLAPTRPPHLGAIFAGGMAVSSLDMTIGIFDVGRRLQWTYGMAVDARRRAGESWGPADRGEANLGWYEVERGKWVWYLPLGDIPDHVFSTLTPVLKAHLKAQNRDFWRFAEGHSRVNVPVCLLTGWYDRLNGTIDHYPGMVERGPESLRGQHRLVVGPWGHSSALLVRHQGPLDFGPHADTTYSGEVARWYDHCFKGTDNGVASEPPVKLFVMGKNRWRFESEWPPAGTEYTDFFLHSGGAANTVDGDGTLSTAGPGGERPDEFDYDPRDPVMSMMGIESQAAVRDQAPLNDRRDILVYQTPTLREDLAVIGPVELRLWASSSAPDTDFTAKLIDVHPNGMAVNLTYGILRTQYRDGYEDPALIDPGVPYELTIKMKPTAIVFKAGHRLRLDVSSSDFPNFDRNHNTGADFWSDVELRVAHQTVFHDKERPSRLVLPVGGEGVGR